MHVGADAEQLEAVVQDGHHQATDDGADDGADAAADGRAADEDGSDGVQLPADAVERAGAGGAGNEDHAGQAARMDMFIMTRKLTFLDCTPESSAACRLPPTA